MQFFAKVWFACLFFLGSLRKQPATKKNVGCKFIFLCQEPNLIVVFGRTKAEPRIEKYVHVLIVMANTKMSYVCYAPRLELCTTWIPAISGYEKKPTANYTSPIINEPRMRRMQVK